MTTTHIDDETMNLYLKTCTTDHTEDSDASLSEVECNEIADHISQCQECRAQLSMMNVLQQHYPSVSQRTALTEEQRHSIYDYLDSSHRGLSTDSSEHQAAQTLIDSVDDALHEALHYQNNLELEAAENTRPEPVQDTASKSLETPGLLTRMSRFLTAIFNVRAPVMATVTASVLLVTLTVMIIGELSISQPAYQVTAYQDRAVITFTERDKLPGIGFFTQDKSRSQAFDSVNIEMLDEDTIKISWPEVAGAEQYNLRLQRINATDSTLLEEMTTQYNHVLYHLDKKALELSQQGGKRYEWVLYGNTTDNQKFYANGGFVISPVNQGDD